MVHFAVDIYQGSATIACSYNLLFRAGKGPPLYLQLKVATILSIQFPFSKKSPSDEQQFPDQYVQSRMDRTIIPITCSKNEEPSVFLCSRQNEIIHQLEGVSCKAPSSEQIVCIYQQRSLFTVDDICPVQLPVQQRSTIPCSQQRGAFRYNSSLFRAGWSLPLLQFPGQSRVEPSVIRVSCLEQKYPSSAFIAMTACPDNAWNTVMAGKRPL